MPELSVIIVNYNVKEFVLNLISSLEQASKELTTEIIVVDNASDDGTVDVLRNKHPNIVTIANQKNVGFGKANNQGLKISSGKYILLINPDTIVKEDTLRKMIDFFERTPDAGMAGCKVLNPDGTLQLPCRRGFPGPWTSFTKVTGLSSLFPKSKLFARYNLTYLDENETYPVDAISGSFMMFRREVYDKIGGFDPIFFMYGEDLDLCYRTNLAGYKVYYYHETEIIHYKGESTKRSSLDETKVFYDAMHLFVNKHISSSFLVKAILNLAITARKSLAFMHVFAPTIISAALDLLIFAGATYLVEQNYARERWVGFPESVKPFIYFIPAVFQVFISFIWNAYNKRSISILRSIGSLLTGLLLITSATFFLKEYAYSRAVVLLVYLIAITSFTSWRFIAKLFFNFGMDTSGKNQRALIIGLGKNAVELSEKLKGNISSIHHVIGLVDFTHESIGKRIGGFEVIGSVENINKVIQEKNIDEVIFPSGELTFEKIFSIVSNCNENNVEFLVAGGEHDFLVGKSTVTMLDHIPLMKIYYNISNPLNRFIKSVFDFALSLPVLLLIYPLIYSFQKLSGRQSDTIKFILEIPKVTLLRKSFVGPKTGEWYEGLYLGKPGLTGMWYSEKIEGFDEKDTAKLDIYYAKNQNIWLDFEILGKTISKMLIGDNK